MCSWLEQLPVSHVTAKRSMTFCLECSYEVSIHTQILQLRVHSKSHSSHTAKATPRRVSVRSWGYEEEIAVISEEAQEEVCAQKYLPAHPKVRGDMKKLVELSMKRIMLLLCNRLGRSLLPRPRMPNYIVRLNLQ